MRTDDRDALRTPDGSFLVALVAFVLIAATGLMLFLTAFVLWMYALTGSLIAGVLIAGGCCTLLAATIYGWLLRPHLCRMQEQIETVYEVARGRTQRLRMGARQGGFPAPPKRKEPRDMIPGNGITSRTTTGR